MFVVFNTSGAADADGTPGTKSVMVTVSVKATDSSSMRWIHAIGQANVLKLRMLQLEKDSGINQILSHFSHAASLFLKFIAHPCNKARVNNLRLNMPAPGMASRNVSTAPSTYL